MEMDGNPYAALAALARSGAEDGEGGASAQAGLGAVSVRSRLGRVETAAPLTVRVAGIVLPPGALRINERLVKGARWRMKLTGPSGDFSGLTGPVSGPVSTPAGTGSLISLTDGTVHSTGVVLDEAEAEQLELDLAEGDEVLLLTQDDQIFYIVMKVVDAV